MALAAPGEVDALSGIFAALGGDAALADNAMLDTDAVVGTP